MTKIEAKVAEEVPYILGAELRGKSQELEKIKQQSHAKQMQLKVENEKLRPESERHRNSQHNLDTSGAELEAKSQKLKRIKEQNHAR